MPPITGSQAKRFRCGGFWIAGAIHSGFAGNSGTSSSLVGQNQVSPQLGRWGMQGGCWLRVGCVNSGPLILNPAVQKPRMTRMTRMGKGSVKTVLVPPRRSGTAWHLIRPAIGWGRCRSAFSLEGRSPKPEGRKKAEFRNPKAETRRPSAVRTSAFFRPSAFDLRLATPLRLPWCELEL